MYTKIKTDQEIESMRRAGRICSETLKLLKETVKAGMTTKDLADIAAAELKKAGARPAFLGYNGFPDVICISVNDEVVHGIPNKKKIIQAGDIISLDLGVVYDEMIVDSAISVLVESKDSARAELIRTTEESLRNGLNAVMDGCHVGDIGAKVEVVLNKKKYGIVRDLVGHGVGHKVHEEPNIPNFGRAGSGPVLHEGMTIAVEPMATMGGEEVYIDSDGWTVKTRDGSLSAHFEQTVLIGENGFEILTPFL